MSHAVGPEDLMRLLDDELSAERRAAVEAHIRGCAECRRDYLAFERMKHDLHSLATQDAIVPSLWTGVNRRLFRPTGWLLLAAGVVGLAAWGIWSYLTSPETVWTKLAAGAVVIGLALLLASALLDRVAALRTDRYREIER